MSEPEPRQRLRARRRDGDRVTFLELFFDLVFVLALTQCTTLMAEHPTARGLAQGLLALAVLWWAWVGYAWLTSVVDPEAGAVRLVMFASMAGLLVAALCVPEAFEDLAVTFAVAYGVVRAAHIALFVIASRGDERFRHSVSGLAVSSAVGVGLLTVAAFVDGWAQGTLWLLAVVIDVGGPFLFGADGWHLEPHHFAERHGLVVIIALGESIVVLGVGSEVGVTSSVIAVAVLGVALAAGLWWLYFDVGALMASERLAEATPGREQNELARDAYSYLHFPMVAGVVLIALGLEHTLAHADEVLDTEVAVALAGGWALFVFAQVAFKHRAVGIVSWPRIVAGAVGLVLVAVAVAVPAWAALVAVLTVTWLLIAFETVHYAETRTAVRRRQH